MDLIDKKPFAGKIAIVTGAASGIGQATALAFGEAGANVVVADVAEAAGTAVARRIEQGGRKALFVGCDVSDENQVQNLVRRAVERFGRIDFAVNNAGIEGRAGPTADCATENWDRVIGVNLKGVWLCMRHEIPQMLAQGSGSIVNVSSIAGIVGFQSAPAYVASKHGIIGLTKTAALEYARKGIRVNAVCPGVIQTPMIDRFTQGDPRAHAGLAASEPIGRVGRPEEVASAILWLCSDGASFVTGHPLVVDGGWVAQ